MQWSLSMDNRYRLQLYLPTALQESMKLQMNWENQAVSYIQEMQLWVTLCVITISSLLDKNLNKLFLTSAVQIQKITQGIENRFEIQKEFWITTVCLDIDEVDLFTVISSCTNLAQNTSHEWIIKHGNKNQQRNGFSQQPMHYNAYKLTKGKLNQQDSSKAIRNEHHMQLNLCPNKINANIFWFVPCAETVIFVTLRMYIFIFQSNNNTFQYKFRFLSVAERNMAKGSNGFFLGGGKEGWTLGRGGHAVGNDLVEKI